MRNWLPALLLLPSLLSGAASPARSQGADRPVFRPTRDVVVGYHLQPGAGEAIDVRVSVAAGGGALRLDLPDQTFMVAMPKAQALTLVVPLERTVLDLPWNDGPQGVFLPDERARYARKGEATVAGQRCTNWDATTERARATMCVTADGVLLRSQSQDAAGRRNLVEAFSVRFQALVESDFAVPDGFERMVAVPKGGR